MSKPNVPHYTQGELDTWDIMEDWYSEDEFHAYLLGNVVKYLQRYRFKGTPVDDLTKASNYLKELLAGVTAAEQRRAVEARTKGDLDPPF